jgi:hypothetical protein
VAQTIFVESDAQAAWVARRACAQPREAVVALTAEAVEALETLAVPHVAVGDVSDLRPLAGALYDLSVGVTRVARQLEAFVGARYPRARAEGPGFVEGHTYVLQHDASTVAARAILILDAINAIRPSSIALFAGPVDRVLGVSGYDEPPVAAVLRDTRPTVALELLPPAAPLPARPEGGGLLSRVRNRARVTIGQLRAQRQTRQRRSSSGGLDGLRLLLADGAVYDWAPVAAQLVQPAQATVFGLTIRPLATGLWSYAYDPVLHLLNEGREQSLPISPYARDLREEAAVGELFDEWSSTRPAEARLDVVGIDILPGLVPHLRHVASRSPALLRHADQVAAAALDRTQPDAVGFFAIPSLASKRVAFAARRRGVPVVAYQHGATYGTHRQAIHAHLEQAHADYFLTYGVGTRLLDYPEFPARAEFVPVGSARIDVMRHGRRRSRGDRLRVLWIGELATENLYGTPFSLEDTRRYALEKHGLTRLTAGDRLEVMYRPHRHQWKESGIARWIERRGLPVTVDVVQPLERLIRGADLIVTDGSSGQVWYEAFGIGVPLVVFCDPTQTHLTPEFEHDLGRACLWCRDEASFLVAIDRLAADPAAAASDLDRIDTVAFVEKYILGAGKGRPVDRVLTFLSALRGRQVPSVVEA